jgi:hypothetical protein
MIQEDLINNETISETSRDEVDVEYKNSYLNLLALLIRSSCVPDSNKQLYA